jgi:hypothetical protein
MNYNDTICNIDVFDKNNKCKVRSVYQDNKEWLFSVHDFINLASEKPLNDHYAKLYWYDYNRSEKSEKIKLQTYVFPNSNNLPVPVGNIRDLQKILLILPSEAAKTYRKITDITISKICSGEPIYIKNNFNENSSESEFKAKIEKLELKIIELENSLKNKDNRIEIKDDIINENRVDLKFKNNLITALTRTNNHLNSKNNVLFNRNISLLNNYSNIPGEDLTEYLTIIRKNQNDYHYNNREKRENETLSDYIKDTYKHYIIRCQYKDIQSSINNFKSNYSLNNYFIIYQEKNSNPGSFLHLLKKEYFIKNYIGNDLQIFDEFRLLNILSTYKRDNF